MSTIYRGERAEGGCVVTVQRGGESYPLDPRYDLRNHSPTGFGWGFNGSGPAQLALALLADALGDERAQRLYQDWKFKVVSRLGDTWEMSREEVVRTALEIEKDLGRER